MSAARLWAVAALCLGMSTGATLAQVQDLKRLNTEQALKTCTGTITDECVVRHFKDTLEASIIRGHVAFQNYCVLCHGAEGKGDGRAAKLHTPRPFNLTQSMAPRDYIAQVVRKGGEAMGRGKGMPPWGDQLTDEQINDTLNYLMTIRVNK
ncbi:c-type cytochrome [Rhodoferax bucti]|uniref:c-type cytochrome n=1 Tax=Rhodoferax bucti TaxID=2576305 RepID=UPI001109F260|nr:cytochrome c [Rhodoferax bucti]